MKLDNLWAAVGSALVTTTNINYDLSLSSTHLTFPEVFGTPKDTYKVSPQRPQIKRSVPRLKNRSTSNISRPINNTLSEKKIAELLTASELAEKLQCSKSYIKKLRASGVIVPAISFSRFVRYKLSDVIAALQRRSLL